jgi:hypothetical protein
MLWTALATLPLMAAIQLTCARIGLVSGRGLAGTMRRHYPPWFVYTACLLLLANVFYLFFWQASQEVEEERARGRGTVAERRGATDTSCATRGATWSPAWSSRTR